MSLVDNTSYFVLPALLSCPSRYSMMYNNFEHQHILLCYVKQRLLIGFREVLFMANVFQEVPSQDLEFGILIPRNDCSKCHEP